MSALEDRLHEALAAEGRRRVPSEDLFTRVVDSIDHDRSRRRRQRVLTASGATAVVAATVAVALFTPRGKDGLDMPWWILEVATTVVLLGVALWLGPFIKRFGRAYAADVFHDNPLTGKSYIVLTDIVYYLIFAAYILFSVHFAPQEEWNNTISERVTAEQLTFEVGRLGGILLIIGILHGLNILLMPVLGRLFSLNRRLPRD
ncbi:hypothetical protein GCM10009867_11430 [Pedococcus aerophilus]|uniref:Uncharacterized protein n=1 Tax=Pedococcus aerophilus TaxID=436356 RepID=A0ABN3UIS2_9MICO